MRGGGDRYCNYPKFKYTPHYEFAKFVGECELRNREGNAHEMCKTMNDNMQSGDPNRYNYCGYCATADGGKGAIIDRNDKTSLNACAMYRGSCPISHEEKKGKDAQGKLFCEPEGSYFHEYYSFGNYATPRCAP